MTWSRLRRIRQAVQVLAFALYVYLLFAALQRRTAFPLADLFFRLDPLAALGAMLADRAWIPRLALALVTLGLTLLLGRVWCGWLCPLGTLLEWARFSSQKHFIPSRWRAVKYLLLLLILAAALFGNLSLLIFDPVTLFTRTMTTAILPALNHAVTSTERVLYAVDFLRPAIDWVERALRGPVFPVIQPVYAMNVFIALLFAGLLTLNALADRFWCRYLCPLGALLGLLSKVALLRPVIGATCDRCARCVGVCRVGAIQPPQSPDARSGYEIVPSECTVCLDCLAACREDGISFQSQWRPAPYREYDPTRRQALIALAAGAAGVAVLRTGAQAKQPHPQLIRPPGAQDEAVLTITEEAYQLYLPLLLRGAP